MGLQYLGPLQTRNQIICARPLTRRVNLVLRIQWLNMKANPSYNPECPD
jgi:hypothetical protein